MSTDGQIADKTLQQYGGQAVVEGARIRYLDRKGNTLREK